jgi:hypothetical protein
MRDTNQNVEVKGHSSWSTHCLAGHGALHSTSFDGRLPQVHVSVFHMEFLIKIKQFVMTVKINSKCHVKFVNYLSLWNRTILEKLTVSQLLKKFLEFSETRRFEILP